VARTMAKQVMRYEASDGQLFDDEDDAVRHSTILLFVSEIHKILGLDSPSGYYAIADSDCVKLVAFCNKTLGFSNNVKKQDQLSNLLMGSVFELLSSQEEHRTANGKGLGAWTLASWMYDVFGMRV